MELLDDLQPLYDQFRGLSEDGKLVFLDMIDPLPDAEEKPKHASKKVVKKVISGGCLRCRYKKDDVIHRDENSTNYHQYEPKRGKSKRAEELSDKVREGLQSRVAGEVDIEDSAVALDGNRYPVEKPILCGVCGNERDYQDHFKPSPSFHEFDSGKSSSPARSAASKSLSAKSGNGGGSGDETSGKDSIPTPSSEEVEASAGAVAGGSS